MFAGTLESFLMRFFISRAASEKCWVVCFDTISSCKHLDMYDRVDTGRNQRDTHRESTVARIFDRNDERHEL